MKKNNPKKRIYLDYASSTPVSEDVLKVMNKYWNLDFANAGGLYKEGVLANDVVSVARKSIASCINANPKEVIFTSGGTEGNNLAILGFVKSLENNGRDIKDLHFITSTIEHSSVLNIFKELERRGAEVSFINVYEDGLLKLDELKKELKDNTVLVSIMQANNEIGTVEPIREISKIIKKYRKLHKSKFPIFHVDACQSPLYLDTNTAKLGVDLMVFDGQKIYGPKGVGALFIRDGVEIKSLFYGGGHERRLRPGTENVPLIAGFSKAFVNAVKNREIESKRVSTLRDYFIKNLLNKHFGIILNGHSKERLANNINIGIPNIDGELFLLRLDADGIAVSTRSACFSKERGMSHVLRAIGKKGDDNYGHLRISLGVNTTKKDLDYVIQSIVKKLKY